MVYVIKDPEIKKLFVKKLKEWKKIFMKKNQKMIRSLCRGLLKRDLNFIKPHLFEAPVLLSISTYPRYIDKHAIESNMVNHCLNYSCSRK